jgi:diguanylate cyclase (GGDEF)-like protein
VGALVLVAVLAVAPLSSFRGIATRVLARLDDAVAESRTASRPSSPPRSRRRRSCAILAYHDELTGLPNRELFYDRLGLAIAHGHRQASHLAVLFLDLDDFKDVNDSHGHGTGDRVLVEVAARIRAAVRAEDTVARLGGDEFVVLLAEVGGAGDAGRVAAKVLDALRPPLRVDGHEVSIAASVGVSVYPGDGTSPDELVRSADAAMYREKLRDGTPGRTDSGEVT